jgi:hypothetical protein
VDRSQGNCVIVTLGLPPHCHSAAVPSQSKRPDRPGPPDSRGRLSPHEHLAIQRRRLGRKGPHPLASGAAGEDARLTAAGTAALLIHVLAFLEVSFRNWKHVTLARYPHVQRWQ